MPESRLALLRGINVGGKNKVAMTDLRDVVAGLGHTDVSTYIQSGNVLFSADPADADTSALAAALAEAITGTLGVRAPVVVISRDELADAITANPFPDEADPKRVHAVLLSGPTGADAAGKIEQFACHEASSGFGGETRWTRCRACRSYSTIPICDLPRRRSRLSGLTPFH